MKNASKITVLAICSLFFALISSSAFAQPTVKDTTVKIKTSSQCSMCKTTIEKAMKKVSGVKSSDLNVDSKELSVTFDPAKVKIEDIRTAVNRAGYDADSTKADKRAYNKLSPCCKKPDDSGK